MYVHRPIQSELQHDKNAKKKKKKKKKWPVRPAWASAFVASYSVHSED